MSACWLGGVRGAGLSLTEQGPHRDKECAVTIQDITILCCNGKRQQNISAGLASKFLLFSTWHLAVRISKATNFVPGNLLCAVLQRACTAKWNQLQQLYTSISHVPSARRSIQKKTTKISRQHLDLSSADELRAMY